MWAIIQPLGMVLVFAVFFGLLIRVPTDGMPYTLFFYCGLMTWVFFSTAVSAGSASLLNSSNLITKVYFPRVLIPLTSLIPPAIDLLIAFIVLLGLMLYYRLAPTLNLIWLPAFMLLGLITTFGAGLWFAAMNVKYRDVRHIVQVLLQFGIFISPVAYPSRMVPASELKPVLPPRTPSRAGAWIARMMSTLLRAPFCTLKEASTRGSANRFCRLVPCKV